MTLAPWKKTYHQSRQCIKKQRHYFVDKVLSSQSYGFSSGHVWMWEMYSLCQQSDIKKKLTEQMAILLASTPKPWSEVLVVHLCPILGDPMECSPPGSSVHGIFHARILEWVTIYFSRGRPDRGIKPRSPALQADSLPTELWGKSYGCENWTIKKAEHQRIDAFDPLGNYQSLCQIPRLGNLMWGLELLQQ